MSEDQESVEEIPKWITCYCGGSVEERMRCDSCKGKGVKLNPKSVICNMCGGDMSCPDEHDKFGMYGTGPLKVGGGFSSPHLHDLTTYHFAFCELCLRNIWSKCKVKPRVDGYIGERFTYEQDEERWKIGQWVEGGGRNRKLPTGRCTRDEWCKNKSTHLYVSSGDIVSNERFCEEHAAQSGSCSNTMWLPANGVRSVFKGDFTLDEWEDLARRYLAAEYGKNLDGKGFYRVWSAEIVRAAVGLPKKIRDDWGSAYSMLIVRKVEDVPFEMFKAKSNCIHFRVNEYVFMCFVAEVQMEDHHKIAKHGFETYGMGEVNSWLKERDEVDE